jgi:curli production assembly/transport component CsgG|tara:strand:- start:2143 stop:3060 length:918 start_codon:yes stop_codon:yes gene_type:complete
MVGKKYHTSIILLLALVSGCASVPSMTDSCGADGNWTLMTSIGECIEAPIVVEMPTHEELKNLAPPTKMPVVAVYSFPDKTGQRKQMDGAALFSTAVTQGAETMLIDALKTAGNGNWFRVVERVGIDHITRERQIVRTTRQQFGDDDDTGLAPLLFAGMVLEGGVIGFDTNIVTGGHGARYLGIGASQAYRRDIVVVHLRAVSTLTGEVLLNVQTSKTILHTAEGYDVFKFVDMDTKLVEIEDGTTENESVTRSLRSCIEAAVLEMIYQGHDKGYWQIKEGHRDLHQANGINGLHPINEEKNEDE